MTPTLSIRVAGRPAPQGSKRLLGHGALVESSSARLTPWRTDVRAAAEAALSATPDWPRPCRVAVHMLVTFRFPRPKSHYRTGKHAGELRADAPHYVTSRGCGDLSHLVRAAEDALVSAGVLVDDSLIVTSRESKVYAEQPGADIELATVAVP